MKTRRKIFLGLLAVLFLSLVVFVSFLVGLYCGNKEMLKQYCHYQKATYTLIGDEYCCVKEDTIIRIPWLQSSEEK